MLNVLIVDNEAAIRRGLAACMDWEAHGYTIAGQAADGIEALELARELEPDVVISDIRMPGMDGLSLAKSLRDSRPAPQVILLTGYPDFSYAQRAINYGVVDYVLKPATREGLLGALRVARERIDEQNAHEEMRRRLDDTSEENILLQRGLFLDSLIRGKEADEGRITRRCRELGIGLGAYQVLWAHVAMPGGSGGELDALLEEACHLLEEALAPYAFTRVRRGGQNSCYVVENAAEPHLLALARQVAHTADALLHCALSIGLSEVAGGARRLPEAARQAWQAQQLASYSASSLAVPFAEMQQASGEDMERLSTLLRLLRLAIEQWRREEARTLLAEVFEAIRKARLPLPEVQKIGNFIVHFCVDSLFAQSGLQGLAHTPSPQRIHDSESVKEAEENLRAYMEEMMASAPGEQGNLAEVVAAVKQYVAGHYGQELTLETLSKVVYLSPGYLSKVFKKETGENLSVYIQNLRIEKAKELLLGTSLKSYEVAGQVGIQDPVYFARMFKHATGIKPKDFRRSQAGGGRGKA